jgi:hypothetical protein
VQSKPSSQTPSPLLPRTPRGKLVHSVNEKSGTAPFTPAAAVPADSSEPDTPTHAPKRASRDKAAILSTAAEIQMRQRISQWKKAQNIPEVEPGVPQVIGFSLILAEEATCNVCGHRMNVKGKRTLHECRCCKWCICSACLAARNRNTDHAGCSAVTDIDSADVPLQSVEFPKLMPTSSSNESGKKELHTQARMSAIPNLSAPRGKKANSPNRFMPYKVGRRRQSPELDSNGTPLHQPQQGRPDHYPPEGSVSCEKSNTVKLETLGVLAPVILRPSFKASPGGNTQDTADPFAPTPHRPSVCFVEEDIPMIDNDLCNTKTSRANDGDRVGMDFRDSMSPPCQPPLPSLLFYDPGVLTSDRFEPVGPAAGDRNPDYEADNNAWQALLQATRRAIEEENEDLTLIAVRGVSPSQASYVHSPTEPTFVRREPSLSPTDGHIPVRCFPFLV